MSHQYTLPPKEAVTELLTWYQANKRDLPWRHDITPYRVWISEIMLQQTRVEAVKPYFHRFLEAFPNVYALAEAEETHLLKLWEGLGYYSRARNLQKAAIRIVTEYGGKFPSDPKELQKLPGIGSYTAGAIATIAFGVPAPAVDGNVLRVLSRVTGDERDIMDPRTRKAAEEAVLSLCPGESPGEFTQAMIELGATLCGPNTEPLCKECPFRPWCIAKRTGKTDLLPVRSKKAPRRIEHRTVLLLKEHDRYMIRRRPAKGLLAGLYELPNELGILTPEEAVAFARENGFQPLHIERLAPAAHIFTHVEWHMTAYLMSGYFEEARDRIMATPEEMADRFAIPSAFAAYIKPITKGI
ncbi:MAG: A/G-specific adenine glycosylase [Clostridia bacterium]|nr:A/G-specific adenine glycosylase [Clostridia bacterium]MBR4053358.1 A/G-specific adenine glycosylase [Clostridia bacterium]